MVYAIKNPGTVSKENIDKTFSNLGLEEGLGSRDDAGGLEATHFCLGSVGGSSEPHFLGSRFESLKISGPKEKFVKRLRESGFKESKGRDDALYVEDNLARALGDEEIGALNKEGLRGSDAFEVAAFEVAEEVLGPADYRLETRLEKDIEEIVKERWRYLVMQFGGVFLTEIRPNKCFIKQDKTLADVLIIYNQGEHRYGLDLRELDSYLRKTSNGKKSNIQIHFSDIMFNPKINDLDIFSITSGDIEKAGIFIDLARFLREYNNGEQTVIPVHLPYYEKWETSKGVVEFGNKSANGERAAAHNADRVLMYFEKEKRLGENVKLALETGGGEIKREVKTDSGEMKQELIYALIYKPFRFQNLMDGREEWVSLCEDVGHLNLKGAADWKDYLTEEISEFHVSGNNGKQDQHTIATPKTLKDYHRIMSYLKFYAGNICAEVGRGELTADEFLRSVKEFAYVLFSEPTKTDFKNLREIESYVKITREGKLNEENLNPERYGKYLEYCEANPSSS